MRIADHAVAMQSSQALQQPSNTVHQQQIVSPEAARAAADNQAQQQAKQVTGSEKTENRGIREEEQANRQRRTARMPAARRDPNQKEQEESPKGVSEPGKGDQLDLLV